MKQYDWHTSWLEEHDARVSADTALEMANDKIKYLQQEILYMQSVLEKARLNHPEITELQNTQD